MKTPKKDKALLDLDKMIRVVARKARIKGAADEGDGEPGSWHTDPNCSAPCAC